MRQTIRYYARYLVAGLHLALLWGTATPARAAAPARPKQRQQSAPVRKKTPAPASKRPQKASTKPPSKAEAAPSPPRVRLKKPKVLAPAPAAHEDPLLPLDTLIVKRKEPLLPYVPWIQTIDVALDYGSLALGLCPPLTPRYEGLLHILWWNNVQLAIAGGYRGWTVPTQLRTIAQYETAGLYYRVGLDYLIKYSARSNIYVGGRYSQSHLSCRIPAVASSVSSSTLKASWCEATLGSEYQLFSQWNLYAGMVGRLKAWAQCPPPQDAPPAFHYIVPGYGSTMQPLVPALTLYIKYKFSFLERSLVFDA